MSRLSRWTLALFVYASILAVLAPPAVAQVQIFSTGYGVPETISLAPSGFGSFGGQYFIPDAKTHDIWAVPVTGAPLVSFANTDTLIPPFGAFRPIGALFLPSGWGDFSGQFLLNGVYAFDSTGLTATIIDPAGAGLATTPLIAPSGFGSYAGHLFVSDQGGTDTAVWETAPPLSGNNAHFQIFRSRASALALETPFGLEFTPPAWGPVSLLVSDGSTSVVSDTGTRMSYIASFDPDHIVDDHVFATIPLKDDPDPNLQQDGLRQMLIAPDGFFAPLGFPGQLLLVSVSGSGQGGGVLGEVLALDSTGAVKAHLKVGSVLAKFDPRGMVFTSDGHLLISDTSDPILIASAGDFLPGRLDAACQPGVASSVSTSTLWPPNHDLVNVGLSACAVTSEVHVFSDEDDQVETGDGNFSPDARNMALGTLRLRAERNAKGDGRVYLVVVKATDSARNVAVSCDTVVVPKDQSKAAKSSVEAQAAAARVFCRANAGAPPPGYFAVGDGPVIGPKQ